MFDLLGPNFVILLASATMSVLPWWRDRTSQRWCILLVAALQSEASYGPPWPRPFFGVSMHSFQSKMGIRDQAVVHCKPKGDQRVR